MAKIQVRIVQIYRAERSITVEVEADDKPSAIESVASGAIDTPSFDDAGWTTTWDLQNEEVH